MSTLWNQWKDLTRFLESARVAFAREKMIWESLEFDDPGGVTISTTTGLRRFEVSLANHLAAVEDEQTLYASVLIHTYALAEDAACAHLGIDSREARGIETWGQRLLTAANRDWTGVLGGLPGAVEVAVVRNAYAHGTRAIDAQASARLTAGGAPARAVGETVALTYEELRVYRDRLRSLLRTAQVGLAAPTGG